jgi:hypothetical protein
MSANEYITKDLGEASALLTNGLSLLRLDKASGVCWFVFPRDESSKSLSYAFHFGELLVNARDYHHTLSKLKRLIHE